MLGPSNQLSANSRGDERVNAYPHVARTERSVGGIYDVSPGKPITKVQLGKRLSSITRIKKIILGLMSPRLLGESAEPTPAISGATQREH
jgi:hypothetical protein